MDTGALGRWFRSGWPLVGVIVAFVVVAAVWGPVRGALAALFSVVFFGPAYLVQTSIRRRRGTLPPPPVRPPEQQARRDALALRAGALLDLAVAIACLVFAAVPRGDLLPDVRWTVAAIFMAALGLTGVPHLWALAELRENRRFLHWAWTIEASTDIVFGTAAAVTAAANGASHWLGGWIWTAVVAALAAMWLLAAPGDIARARR